MAGLWAEKEHKEKNVKIAFWSEEDGCGTTSGMAAVASVCSNAWNMKTILMQSRNQEGDLRKKLESVPLSGMVREESSYYALDGLDYLLWQEKNKKLNEAMVTDSIVPIAKGRMYYLPQGERRKPQVCSEELKGAMWQVICKAEQLADITFIDCGSGKDELAEHLLGQADAVVVNLSQERQNLDAYFQKRHAFSGKAVYLVNQYQQESVYNKKNLNRLYRLQEETLGVIPWNPLFRHASDKGKVDRFIRRHIRCSVLDHQYYFMQELIETAHIILKAAGFAQ